MHKFGAILVLSVMTMFSAQAQIKDDSEVVKKTEQEIIAPQENVTAEPEELPNEVPVIEEQTADDTENVPENIEETPVLEPEIVIEVFEPKFMNNLQNCLHARASGPRAVRAALRVGVQSVKLPDMWSMERK